MCPTLSFSQISIASFPFGYRHAAENAAQSLMPYVDASYRSQRMEAWVQGTAIQIPRRIHFVGLERASLEAQDQHWFAIQCLCSRSTDGYERQAAIRALLTLNDAANIPFVVLLAGEYVVEIIIDMVSALPTLDRAAYANFVRENRATMRSLRAMATSYWNRHYRTDYPDRRHYPGLAFLHEIERWAA